MSTFQIIMMVAAAFFAFKIYEHVRRMDDEPETQPQPQRGQGSFSPFDPEALIERADEAFGKGDLSKALALLQEADVKAPENVETMNKIAFILGKQGATDEAIEMYSRSLALEGNDDLAHNAIASLYRQKGEADAAREHYEAALAIDGNYEVTFYNYANLLAETGEFEKAKQLYERALELNPGFEEAREALAEIESKA